MTSLNVSLPESMREWIDDQVKKGGYGTASEFVREVIREAQKNKARQELEAKCRAKSFGAGVCAVLSPTRPHAERARSRRPGGLPR